MTKKNLVTQIVECIEEIYQDEFDVDGDSESQWLCSRSRHEILEQEFNHLEDWQYQKCEVLIDSID